MKSIVTIFSFLIFSTFAMAQYERPFEVYEENDQFGLRDSKKQIVVKPVYKNIKRSSFGLFAVQDKRSKWALFNDNGVRVTKFEFDNMEQRLPKIIELRKGGLVGLFDEKGKELIPIQYNKITAVGQVFLAETGKENNNMKAKDFLFRGAIVTKGNLSGYLDQNGQEILGISYQRIQATADFQFDLGIVNVIGLILKKNNLYGIVDENGREIIPMNYSYINSLNQLGFGELQQNGKKGLYNTQFKIVAKPQFDNISILNKSLFAGAENKIWSIFQLPKVTKPLLTCEAVKALGNQYSKVTLKDKNGAIDENGKLVLPFEYDYIMPFGKNLFLIKNNKNYIFTSAKKIIPWNFSEKITWYNQNETLKPIRFPNGKIGYINDDAKTIINPEYEQATAFKENIAIVCNDGKCGFINDKGNLLLPIQYELPTLNYQPTALLAKKNDKYGYLTYQGETIISIRYDEIEAFKPIMKAKLNGKYGFIDAKENVIIPLKYDFIEDYDDSKNEFRFIDKDKFGRVDLSETERYSINLSTWADKIYPIEDEVRNIKIGNNYGLLNAKNQWIFPMQYQKYINFDSEGKAIVRANQKWGMVNKEGEIIIPIQYDERLEFSAKNFACIRKNNRFGIIRKDGKVIVPPIYDTYIYSDYEFWIVQKNKKQGIINQEGKVLIPTNYEKVFPYMDGMALVKKDGKWGYINKKNQIIIPFEYDVLNSFIDGQALASKSEKWGIIDLNNQVLLPFIFDNLIHESNDFISANKNGFWGVLDAKYNIIIPYNFDKISQIKNFFKVEKNEKIGIFSLEGKMILPTYYDALTIEDKVGFKVKKDGKFGLISSSGKVVAPVIYDEMSFFVQGFSRVKKGEKYGMLSQNGELMIPCKYDNLGSRFQGKYVEAMLKGKWGILNQFGKKMVKFKYDKIRFVSNNEIEGLINGTWEVLPL